MFRLIKGVPGSWKASALGSVGLSRVGEFLNEAPFRGSLKASLRVSGLGGSQLCSVKG